MKKINILGTEYTIEFKDYEDHGDFDRYSADGLCDHFAKEITICNLSSRESWKGTNTNSIRAAEKKTLRHEIIHAFLNESGLKECSATISGGWAEFDEMIDWIALQGPKIFEAWKTADAI